VRTHRAAQSGEFTTLAARVRRPNRLRSPVEGVAPYGSPVLVACAAPRHAGGTQMLVAGFDNRTTEASTVVIAPQCVQAHSI